VYVEVYGGPAKKFGGGESVFRRESWFLKALPLLPNLRFRFAGSARRPTSARSLRDTGRNRLACPTRDETILLPPCRTALLHHRDPLPCPHVHVSRTRKSSTSLWITTFSISNGSFQYSQYLMHEVSFERGRGRLEGKWLGKSD
jgi:hypothetical protein